MEPSIRVSSRSSLMRLRLGQTWMKMNIWFCLRPQWWAPAVDGYQTCRLCFNLFRIWWINFKTKMDMMAHACEAEIMFSGADWPMNTCHQNPLLWMTSLSPYTVSLTTSPVRSPDMCYLIQPKIQKQNKLICITWEPLLTRYWLVPNQTNQIQYCHLVTILRFLLHMIKFSQQPSQQILTSATKRPSALETSCETRLN